jgi:cytochrome P450
MSEKSTPTTTAADLTALFTRLGEARVNEPVRFNETLGAWEVFRYADVTTVLSDPATFSSDLTEFVPSDPDVDKISKGNLITMDPPKHRQLRGLVSKAFTPRFVADLEPRITAVANQLLDDVAGRSQFDMIDSLSYPLPVIVISEMLGIPASDRETFRRWADILLDNEPAEDQAITDAVADQVSATAPTIREMNAYMVEHIQRQRANPGEDLIGALLTAEMDGRELDDDEIAWFGALLLLAGHITTTALLGNTAMCLDERPDVLEEIRADRSLIPATLEEVLRLRPPFTKLARVARRDVTIGGIDIPAGQIIFAWLASANRDPARFENPDQFDHRRDPNKQAAFGHGIHFCLGAPLARLEARIAVNLMLDRYSKFSVSDHTAVDYFDVNALIGPKYLPLDTVTAG